MVIDWSTYKKEQETQGEHNHVHTELPTSDSSQIIKQIHEHVLEKPDIAPGESGVCLPHESLLRIT